MSIFHTIGTVSHGTLIPRDIANAFAGCLERLIAARTYSGDPLPELDTAELQFTASSLIDAVTALNVESRDIPSGGEQGETVAEFDCRIDVRFSELAEDLMDFLNRIAPSGWYFGSHEGDGSDYGFWRGIPEQDDGEDDIVF